MHNLSDEDLSALTVQVEHEEARRATIRSYKQVANRQLLELQAAMGVAHEHGDPWEAPNPLVPATTYPLDMTVTHEGKTWQSLVPNNVCEPGQSTTWKAINQDEAEILAAINDDSGVSFY